jgi:hypothetical protein
VKKHIYNYDKIVIGSGLNAATYAFLNDLTLIQNCQDPPLIYEKEKLRLWNYTLFSLSLAAKIPITNEVQFIRIDDGNELLVSTKNNQVVRFAYEELIVFDDENIQGLTLLKSTKGKKKVLDWFHVKSGMSHVVEIIKTDSNFVEEIKFYISERLDGVHMNKKDLVATSYLNDEQLRDIEYSDSYVRLKVLNLMKQNNIRGNSNGQGKHYALQIEHAEREVKNISKNKYKEEKGIKFCSFSHEGSLSEIEQKLKGLWV